jgi:hypothetical protein
MGILAQIAKRKDKPLLFFNFIKVSLVPLLDQNPNVHMLYW